MVLPEHLLLRVVIDYSKECLCFKDSIKKELFIRGGIETLLTNCITNGNDKFEGGVPCNVVETYGETALGYQENDVMWAKDISEEKQRTPHTWSGACNGVNIAILIYDKISWNLLSYTVYGQKDVRKRRDSLLGIVLFDMNSNESESRPEMFLQLTCENIKDLTEKIKNNNYFSY